MKKTEKGFTLVELLVVVIVLGILAGIGIPQYTRAVEKGKMREAEANLNVMYMAQKMFKLDNPTVGYVSCGFSDCGVSSVLAAFAVCTVPYPDCDSTLGVEMTKKYFEYYCAASDGTPVDTKNDAFSCFAYRNSGKYKYAVATGCYVRIDSQDFNDGEGKNVSPGNIGYFNCP